MPCINSTKKNALRALYGFVFLCFSLFTSETAFAWNAIIIDGNKLSVNPAPAVYDHVSIDTFYATTWTQYKQINGVAGDNCVAFHTSAFSEITLNYDMFGLTACETYIGAIFVQFWKENEFDACSTIGGDPTQCIYAGGAQFYSDDPLVLYYGYDNGEIGAGGAGVGWDISTTTPVFCTTGECSLTNIGGCFKEALCWAFVPATESLPNFGTLGDMLKQKPPIGYWNGIAGELSAANIASGTPTFTLATSSAIYANIFSPIRTSLVWVFWIAFIMWTFIRLKNIAL